MTGGAEWLPRELSCTAGELRDVAVTPATHHCQLYQHLLAGTVGHGLPCGTITACATSHFCQPGELRGKKGPLGAERQRGSDADQGRAGCEGTAALQLQQSGSECLL